MFLTISEDRVQCSTHDFNVLFFFGWDNQLTTPSPSASASTGSNAASPTSKARPSS
jgi:hypothetical protein